MVSESTSRCAEVLAALIDNQNEALDALEKSDFDEYCLVDGRRHMLLCEWNALRDRSTIVLT